MNNFRTTTAADWFGGSFGALGFSEFLETIQNGGREGRVSIEWTEENNGVIEFGQSSMDFFGNAFTNPRFRVSYQSEDSDIKNIQALKKLLTVVYGIGKFGKISGEYVFQPDAQESVPAKNPGFTFKADILGRLLDELEHDLNAAV